MATVTATSTTAPSNQISIYGHPSPVNSATATPANNSPTSPRLTNAVPAQLPLQNRQLRPLKGPLYVPAALRPTERAQKSCPPSPPRSVHGSLDSLNETPAAAAAALAAELTEPISRRSTMESTVSVGGISKMAEDEWKKKEDLGLVTGVPTKDHWKADSASPNCDSPTCRSSFGIFLRRHHCRHCGHVFCSSHTPHTVPLDEKARFHPEGVHSRACDLCWHAYQRWEEVRNDQVYKIQHDIDAQKSGDESSQDGSEGSQNISRPSNDGNQQSTDIAASVPRGWNWSTF